jgi:hypothetical protein
MRAEKPLFKPCLNKEIRPVEHLGLESRRVLGKMHQCQFGKNQPDPSTSGWKFTQNHDPKTLRLLLKRFWNGWRSAYGQ